MAGGWSPPGRPARRLLPLLALLAANLAGCAYLNTFYNAERAYEEGVRIQSAGGASLAAASSGDSLAAAARSAFQRAAEKSAIVLARHPDSKYADDALLLLGRSLQQLGSHVDAAAAFRRYLTNFPDGDDAGRARLGLVESERLAGQLQAAEAALAPLLAASDEGADPAEVLHEKGLIELELGAYDEAATTFRRLLEDHPRFAEDRDIALQFADAHLAAGEFAAALEGYGSLRQEAGDPSVRREVGLRIARAQALTGQRSDAIATYDSVLTAGVPDTLAARIHSERGDLFAADSSWTEAEAAYRRASELAPGTDVASRATLRRGRIAWQVREDRQHALDVLLDAFLHAPVSAWGDSARAESRALARVIHYERLAGRSGAVAGIDDPALARSTALYRLGEELLEAESDPIAAAAVFGRLADEYTASPWRPRALLAAGLLQRNHGQDLAGEARLLVLIAEHPDTPEADSARRALDLPLPERGADFYAAPPDLAALAAALPDAEDPMATIVDQLDRYASRPDDPLADRREGLRRGETGTAPRGPLGTTTEAERDSVGGELEPEPERPRLPADRPGIQP